MNKHLKSFSTVLLINVMVVSTVFANPQSSQLQTQQSKLQQDKSSLQTVQSKRANMEINIENLDSQIVNQMAKITDNKNYIAKKQLDIKSTETQIKKIDTDILKDQELCNNRVRCMYISGTTSYVSMLLSSQGFSDFISRVDVIGKIMALDKKIIKDLNDKKNDNNNKKEILNNENKKLIELNSQNQANLTQLQQYILTQKNMIVTLKSKEFALASSVDSSEATINATLLQIAEIRKAAPRMRTVVAQASYVAPSISISRGATPISSNNIIAYATNFLGTPYVWGGTSPSPGFDCSGFTQYVYAHFGISLGRTTYDQINDGVGVSKSDLQPGDLVFFGTNGSPEHTGMYVANGTYINAPHTGDVVKIASVNRSDYMTARRVK